MFWAGGRRQLKPILTVLSNAKVPLVPEPIVPRAAMPRFIAIDGLRAWMAWVVVITHIIQQSSSAGGGEAWIKLDIGGEAVNVFIIISGFVITHLLVERPGPYFSYIIPRFMRLFPAFFVACIVGGLVYTVGNRWAAPAWFEPLHGSDYRSLVSYFPIHVVAHITMLHG
ncbi:MAG: acyltransferase, partial [Oxalobacteraceae bacterium]